MENNLLDDFGYLDKEKPKLIYVGLVKRLMATFVDAGALLLVLVVLFMILQFVDFLFFYGLSAKLEELLVGIIVLVYYPIMESSPLQGSFGKHFMKIKVIDREGNKISLGLATARFALKFLSYGLLFIGFIMIAFTKNKQGLHDIILETYVVEKQ